ncbi:hypothetical protein [Thermococcus peptonophilus]|uniref:hypothetical protein n=1 Tax=Thermococcus peptonophilus TaxID=53952 RepID=UPI0034658F1B
MLNLDVFVLKVLQVLFDEVIKLCNLFGEGLYSPLLGRPTFGFPYSLKFGPQFIDSLLDFLLEILKLVERFLRFVFELKKRPLTFSAISLA